MKNNELRNKVKTCNADIDGLINNLNDIKKGINDYVNTSNALDVLDNLNMPIDPSVAFQLISLHINIVSNCVVMANRLDKVADSLNDLTKLIGKDFYGPKELLKSEPDDPISKLDQLINLMEEGDNDGEK